ncbi:MAG: transposase, partial [Treponema sp.]|nr:transposase [Treponema sp.]
KYSREFKAEAAAPAEKHEKPVSRIAVDLGVNENMPHRWMQQAREAVGTGLPPSPDTGGPGTKNRPACGRKSNPSGRRMKS